MVYAILLPDITVFHFVSIRFFIPSFHRIKSDKQAELDWEQFHKYFRQVHENFDNNLRAHFNDLTNNEIRLAALLKMSLSAKEIASILNISPDSVNKARYRLRKKLNLSSEDSLYDFIIAL